MNWSSVKNLLIAILLAANLFIVYNIVRQDRQHNYIDEQVVGDAVTLLAQRGLTVDADAVPLKKFNGAVYESSYNDEYYTEVAQVLSGAGRDLLLSLPDGGFSISATNGAIVEFDSEFGFLYQKNDTFKQTAYIGITPDNIASMSGTGEPLKGALRKTLNKKTESFLTSCFKSDSVPETEITDGYTDPESGLNYVFALQRLGGYDIFSHFAVCVFDGEEMTGAYGRWFFSGFRDTHSTQLADQVNILFSDLETLKADSEDEYGLPESAAEVSGDTPTASVDVLPISVDSMGACYVTYWNADKTALYFIPAWQIGHSDGSIIVYDATNSTVYSRTQ